MKEISKYEVLLNSLLPKQSGLSVKINPTPYVKCKKGTNIPSDRRMYISVILVKKSKKVYTFEYGLVEFSKLIDKIKGENKS